MPRSMVGKAFEVAGALRVIGRSGMIPFPRLDHIARMSRSSREAGPYAGVLHAQAANGVTRPAIVDEAGPVTYQTLDRAATVLASRWRSEGIDAGSVIGALCRNHRGFLLTLAAAGRLGARVVLLNTGFSAPQLVDVATREGVEVFVFDEEFAELAAALPEAVARYCAWPLTQDSAPSIHLPIDDQAPLELTPPASIGSVTLLTSGTTGLPKGASRGSVSPLVGAMLLDRVPLRAEQTMMLAAPAFHATGLGLLSLGLALRQTLLMTNRFDAEKTLRMVAEHRADVLVLVPTMLQRMVDLDPVIRSCYDTSSLQVIFSAGSAISPDLCRRTRDEFGDVLHNMYGSTEVAVVSVAKPEDIALAPGTAGRAPVTCRFGLYDADGNKITDPGVVGRIFATNAAVFHGYTDGGDKERLDGMVSTGDMGHHDEHGLLFIDGRSDDMIVSGGENVYPREVEDLLSERADVLEVAVVGVADVEFGQRLRACIVPAPDATRDPEEIKAYVKARTARFKVPRDVIFIEELPRNATGKLLRSKLAESPVG